MKRRRVERTLHLALLRTRGAAARIELALAVHDISDRLDPLRRAADAIGSLGGAIGSRRRTLKWLAAAAAAVAQVRWIRQAVTGVAQGLRSGATLPMRTVTLAAVAVVVVGLLLRRSEGERSKSQRNRGEETG